MLSEELDNLQRSICYDCKKKFVPRVASSWDSSLSCGIVSGSQMRSPVSTTNTSIPILARQNQSKAAILMLPQASSKLRRPGTIPAIDEISAKQPGWSVLHNPEIKQALHIDLVNTFNFIAKVYCVKFSPDGKYLAVGLDKGGKTYIYDVETGLNVWLVPYSQG